MTQTPQPRESIGRQVASFALFAAKVVGYLAALFAFAYVIYLLRRHLH